MARNVEVVGATIGRNDHRIGRHSGWNQERPGGVFEVGSLATQGSAGIVGLHRIERIAACLNARQDGIRRTTNTVVDMSETGSGEKIRGTHVARDRVALRIQRTHRTRAGIG